MTASVWNNLLLNGIQRLQNCYQQEKIRFYSEADLQCYLFSECLKLVEQGNFEKPYLLHVERKIIGRRKVDLVLGADEVFVELKLEPDRPGVSKPVVFSTKKDAGRRGKGSVEEDLERIQEYASSGIHAHFLMLDEDGIHADKLSNIGEWTVMTVRNAQRFWIHQYIEP